MKVLVSGASGFIGSALTARLADDGHDVIRLVRAQPNPGAADVPWDPAAKRLDPSTVEGFDAAVHLAGDNISQGRWTKAKKARLYESRVPATQLLAGTMAELAGRPGVLVCASAIGFYGDRGDEELDEQSPPGSGFLPELCRDWESATRPAAEAGIRVVNLRFGMVLSATGGALAKMLPVFRLGLGGPLGGGRQYVSWITLGDVLAVIRHALAADSLQGPVNAVAPQPVTNREFALALGRALRRPAMVPVPAFALRAMLGQLAHEVLLSSTRAVPRRLLDSGFSFHDPDLQTALRRLLATG